MNLVCLYITDTTVHKKNYYGLSSEKEDDVLVHTLCAGTINNTVKFPERALKNDFILLEDEIKLAPVFISRIQKLRLQLLINLTKLNLTKVTLNKLRILFKKKLKITFVFQNSMHHTQGVRCVQYILSRTKTKCESIHSRLFQQV